MSSDPAADHGTDTDHQTDTDAASTARSRLLGVSVAATAAFVAAALAAALLPERLGTPAAVLDVVLFAAGSAAFAAALVRAAGRSRAEELSVAGLFLLAGSAPRRVRRVLLGCLVIQTVVAFATAAARPFTPLAFGVLVPTFGLGACGLWAALHGTFPAKRAAATAARAGLERRQPPVHPDGGGPSARMGRPQSLPTRRRRR